MLASTQNILIVEDEEDLSELIALSLKRLGFAIKVAHNIAQAQQLLKQNAFDLVLTDMRLPDGLGFEIIQTASTLKIKSIMMTAYASTEDAIQALKLGAVDYLTKPVSLEKLRHKILDILNVESIKQANPNQNTQNTQNIQNIKSKTINQMSVIDSDQQKQEHQQKQQNIERLLIGQSPAMRKLKQNIQQYANSPVPIMVLGQTGTGKERVAQALHLSSQRAQNPLVTINCASIPEALLESELFGYKKGAFSGAQDHKIGLIQAAHQGTLFLDEIAEMALPLQAKLLRVLQERKVRALGDTQETSVDIKIICATHQNLAEYVRLGHFREDLFYRIHVLAIELPSLNERLSDIPLLATHFLEKIIKLNDLSLYQQMKQERRSFLELLDAKALDFLQQFHYQGNIRQLENMLQVAYLNAEIEARQIINEFSVHKTLKIKVRHLEDACIKNIRNTKNIEDVENRNLDENISLKENKNHQHHKFVEIEKLPQLPNILESTPNPLFLERKLPFDLPNHIIEIEKYYIKQALQMHGLNQSAIAKALGLSLRQLRYRFEQHPELTN